MKYLMIIAGAIVALLILTYLIFNKPLPQGVENHAAELLTDKMLQAVNKEAWDSTRVIQWNFRDHKHLWDKDRQYAQVRWGDMRVIFNTTTLTGIAFQNESRLEGKDAKEAIQTAWEYFANDSFWLAAPFKVRDPGTTRQIVQTERGDALLVKYTSGGVTPGDAYLWFLDDEGLPYAWQMWVQMLPIGGLEFSWENWEVLPGELKIATSHRGIINIPVKNIVIVQNAAELNNGKDPFVGL